VLPTFSTITRTQACCDSYNYTTTRGSVRKPWLGESSSKHSNLHRRKTKIFGATGAVGVMGTAGDGVSRSAQRKGREQAPSNSKEGYLIGWRARDTSYAAPRSAGDSVERRWETRDIGLRRPFDCHLSCEGMGKGAVFHFSTYFDRLMLRRPVDPPYRAVPFIARLPCFRHHRWRSTRSKGVGTDTARRLGSNNRDCWILTAGGYRPSGNLPNDACVLRFGRVNNS